MQIRRFSFFLIIHFISLILIIESLFFLLAVIVSFIYHEEVRGQMVTSLFILLIPGLLLFLLTVNKRLSNLTKKESIFIVASGWVVMALFGSVPYLITKAIPQFSYAFFESMSGFTTTGSSILTDVEALPKSILFWRSETHWIGGMGIIVLIIALSPVLIYNSFHLYCSEMSNVVDDRAMTRIKYFARRIWLIYIGLTFIETISLKIAGMPLFDSICHSFATVATGGFSTKNASLAAYSPAIQYIVMFFMVLSGMNFMVHVLALKGNFTKIRKSEELKFYLLIMFVAGTIISVALMCIKSMPLEASVRNAFFQVVSVLTATGFVSNDYLLWPPFSVMIIMMLMLVGASSGSTGGGVKVIRNVIALKKVRQSFKNIAHPNAINYVRYNGHILKSDQVLSVLAFIILYYLIVGGGTFFMMCLGLDKSTSFGAVVTTMGGIGPGFGNVGPTGNFSQIPEAGKYFLVTIMVVGRLEIYPVLIILTPWFWKDN